MSRKTVYNKIVDEFSMMLIDEQNKQLQEDFLNYLSSVDRSEQTIMQYKNDLNIFFVWNLKNNNNKFFIDIKKREFVRFQAWCINTLGWSSKRVRRVKSCLSSLSNYIEDILDDEYEGYKNVVKKIESPSNDHVRDNTILLEEDIDKLLKYLIKNEQYEKACAIAICAFSGMRKSELTQMKMSFFNDDHLVFDGALYKTDKIRSKGRGKKGKQINKYIMVSVRPYIEAWKNKRKELGIDIDDVFVVFDSSKNIWRKRKSVDGWVKEFSDFLGYDFYYHALRHYVCTKLVNEYNLPQEIIREFFQWNSLDMITIYNDVSAETHFGKYFTKNGVVKQKTGSFDG